MTQLSIAGRMIDKIPAWGKEKEAQMIFDLGGVFLVHPLYPPLVWDVEAAAWRETK